MTLNQSITPNPDIPCTPGWCLQYVRQAFGLAAHYDTATEAWDNSASQHPDKNFPQDCWVPVWFSLEAIPAGHVALLAPDGSVYSSSDNASTPHHHPSLDDLINYYAYYHLPLTYLGWTEDVAGTPVVVDNGTINFESAPATPTPSEEDDMSKQAEDNIARLLQIAEAQETDNIRQRIVAIDDRTATAASKYLKGDGEATLYSFEDGKLRGISLAEWQVTGLGYRTLPQDIINALPKEA